MDHFYGIYGIGAVIMILALQYFSKTNHRLFLGGVIVGAVVEYSLSLIGEWLLNVKWWDYSDKFLNINGRICLLYSIFWGLLGVYLIKIVNPKIDKLIDYLKTKIKVKVLKIITAGTIVFMVLDCMVSAVAIDLFLVRIAVTKDLPIQNKEQTIQKYEQIYQNEQKAEFVQKYWNDDVMVKTYPNLTITLQDGSIKRVREYLPEIKPYYYKWE